MKRERTFDQLLERGLQELDRVGDVDAVLRRYPEKAEHLRPMLEMAQATRRYYDDVPEPPGGLRAGRERLLQAAARQREQDRTAAQVTRREQVGAKEKRPMFRFAFATKLITAVLAVIVGVTAVGGGVTVASADSLPGDMLYPAKISLENARMRFAVTPVSQFNLALQFADERLEEMERMVQQGQTLPQETVAQMHQLLNQAMTQAAQTGEDEMPGMLEQIMQRTQTQAQAMEQLQSQAQEKNRAQIANALQICQRIREQAMIGIEDPQIFRSRYQHRDGMPDEMTRAEADDREPGGPGQGEGGTPQDSAPQGGQGQTQDGDQQQDRHRQQDQNQDGRPQQDRNRQQDQTQDGQQQQDRDRQQGQTQDGDQQQDRHRQQDQNQDGKPQEDRDRQQDQSQDGEPQQDRNRQQDQTQDGQQQQDRDRQQGQTQDGEPQRDPDRQRNQDGNSGDGGGSQQQRSEDEPGGTQDQQGGNDSGSSTSGSNDSGEDGGGGK